MALLKLEIVSCSPNQHFAFEGEKLVSVILEGIEKTPHLSVWKVRIRRTPYRLVKAVGACLAALGVDAIVFGGRMGENTPLVRERVCASLRWCGLEMDAEKNRTLIEQEGKISTAGSTLQALVILTEEGLEIAHECMQALWGWRHLSLLVSGARH